MAYPLTFSFFSRKFDTCERRNQRSETRLIIHSHMHTFFHICEFPGGKTGRLRVRGCALFRHDSRRFSLSDNIFGAAITKIARLISTSTGQQSNYIVFIRLAVRSFVFQGISFFARVRGLNLSGSAAYTLCTSCAALMSRVSMGMALRSSAAISPRISR